MKDTQRHAEKQAGPGMMSLGSFFKPLASEGLFCKIVSAVCLLEEEYLWTQSCLRGFSLH